MLLNQQNGKRFWGNPRPYGYYHECGNEGGITTNVAMKVEGLKLNYIDIDLIPINNSVDMLDTNVLAQ